MLLYHRVAPIHFNIPENDIRFSLALIRNMGMSEQNLHDFFLAFHF